jgi:hypothetical protein
MVVARIGRRLAAVAAAAVVMVASGCTAPGSWEVRPVSAPPNEVADWRPVDADCATPASCVVVGDESSASTAEWSLAGGTTGLRPVPVGAAVTLSGVSCAASDDCVAVGIGRGPEGLVPAARRFDGTAWHALPAPPRRVSHIDCTATDRCLAVGQDISASPYRLVAVTFDGTAWRDITPDPRAFAFLVFGVACAGPDDCVASGWDSGPAVARWDGRAWARADLPGAPDTGYLVSVDCTGDVCLAVGHIDQDVPLAFSRRNGSWSPAPPPASVPAAGFNDVACAEGRCVVGGGREGASLLLRWDGVGWSAPVPGAPPGYDGVSQVACAPAAGAGADAPSCVAVAWSLAEAGEQPSLAVAAGGAGAWRPVPAPVLRRQPRLDAVSCSGGACLAVGEHAFAGNGATWAPVEGPGRVADVSCATPVFCLAVQRPDGPDAESQGDGLVRWDGQRFTPVVLPAPQTAIPSQFLLRRISNVSCVAPDACVAIGADLGVMGAWPVTLIWDGRTWRQHTDPGAAPSGATSLSCWAADGCLAVGTERGPMPPPGITPVRPPAAPPAPGPAPRPAAGELTAMTSPPPPGPDRPVVFRWDGTGWTRLGPLGVAGATDASLSSVSCVSATFCAVAGFVGSGAYGQPGGYARTTTHPLVGTFDGAAWHFSWQSPPPGHAQATHASVACSSDRHCVAVGSTSSPGANPWGLVRPVANVWNGRDWLLGPPLPGEPDQPLDLDDVSCGATADSCVAVGGEGVTARLTN